MRIAKTPFLLMLSVVVAALAATVGVASGEEGDGPTISCSVSAEDPIEGEGPLEGAVAVRSLKPASARRTAAVQQLPTANSCFTIGLIASGDPYKPAVIKESTSSKLDVGAPSLDPTKVGETTPYTFKVTVANLTKANSSFKAALVTSAADNRPVTDAAVGYVYNAQNQLELTITLPTEERVKTGVIVNLQMEQK